MIPKTIHYIWFGGKPLSPLVQTCIASWKRNCPGYEIVKWDESNFDVHANPYCAQAYQAKKWAFASDYARLWVLAHEGGIYMDTDVEVLASFDCFLDDTACLGFEAADRVMTGVMASETGHPFFTELLASYSAREFDKPGGRHDLTTNVSMVTRALESAGLRLDGSKQRVADTTVYPAEYFSPKDWLTGKLVLTDNTHAVHHYDGSWAGAGTRMKHAVMRALGPDGVAFVKRLGRGGAQ